MGYPEKAFDTVSISHALCEFDDGDRTALLRIMRRLIRPGGVLIVSDTPRDQKTEPELTHVLLHDWWSDVDAHNGVLHRPFRARVELVAQVEVLELRSLRLFDVPDSPGDPHDPAQIAWIDGVIDTSLRRVADETALHARGIELRERMHRVGFRLSTAQVAIGEV